MSLRLRRHTRHSQNGKVRVSWDGDSRQNVCVAKIVDISRDGMQISCPEAIAPRSIIQFQFLERVFEGSASVRSCVRYGVTHRIGVEFCGGLQWNATKAGEATYTE